MYWKQVMECRLVVDPRTRESRGFGFVTMDSLEDAERCIKYLNRSILEGRVITVEKVRHFVSMTSCFCLFEYYLQLVVLFHEHVMLLALGFAKEPVTIVVGPF